MKKGAGDPFEDDEPETPAEEGENPVVLEEDPEPVPQEDLVDVIVRELDAVDEGERGDFIGVRDDAIAALLGALEEREDDRVTLGDQLSQTLGNREPSEDYDKSELLRLAIRVGLQEGSDGTLDDLKEAVSRKAMRNV